MENNLSSIDKNRLRHYLPSALAETITDNGVPLTEDWLQQCIAHLAQLLDVSTSHLPTYLVERLRENPIAGQANGQFVTGTLLFADISGFTAMSEKLNQIGREGAEEITVIVNRYFTVMLEIMREYDGQLIKFGGDALLALFAEPPTNSSDRAIKAALTMQASMDQFAETATSQGTFPLLMSIGIHHGTFFAAQLGNTRNMEYALFGDDVNATAATESTAQAGQVVITNKTYELVEDKVTAVVLPDAPDYYLVQTIDLPPQAPAPPLPNLLHDRTPSLATLHRALELLDAFTPYLPAGLLNRLAGDLNATSLSGEHRLVATVFVNVHGLGEIANRLGAGQEEKIVTAMNYYFVTLVEAIERFEGVINKVDLYDHGDKLLAFFGAPVAHEDDAERAVRAALAMQNSMKEIRDKLPSLAGLDDLHLDLHIGVSYNFVFAGYVGSDWRHEYTVMGDEVNLAARLMSVAEMSQTIVSSNVQRKVQGLFNVELAGEVRLKGKSQLIPIHAVMGVRAFPDPVRGLEGMHSALVGRDKESQHLQDAYHALQLGTGQIVAITGEAGLGKSRLVAELQAKIERQAVLWYEGRCLSYTESVSYWPFQELIRQMLRIRVDEETAVVTQQLHYNLEDWFSPEDARANLPYIANFLNLTLDASMKEQLRHLDAEALQRRTFVAIRALIEAQAQHSPIVLFLDDLHWLDSASQTLLEYLLLLVEQLPVLFLLLYRPEKEKACQQIAEKASQEFKEQFVSIALQPLNNIGSQAMLANLIDNGDWPIEVQELIFNRTEGNPLYIEEVIRSLIEDGLLKRNTNGRWQLNTDVANITVPDTLQGVIMTRIDRLDEPSRRTAQVASVIGRIFPFDVVSQVTAVAFASSLDRYVTDLQEHQVVIEAQRTPELLYAFLHSLVQEVCYENLSVRARREYHCRIVDYLETNRSQGWGDTEGLTPLLAHHAYTGQDWPRALKYQMQAGRRAQDIFANTEAIDHFTKALECLEHLPQTEYEEIAQSVHLAIGQLYVVISKQEEAQKHLVEAYNSSVRNSNSEIQASACRWMAQLHTELSGNYEAAFQEIEKGLAALAGREQSETAQLLLIAGLIHTRQGDYDEALQKCNRALHIAEVLGEITVVARSYTLLGHITRLRGDSILATKYFKKTLQLYTEASDIRGQAMSHNQLANAYFNTGQWQDATYHYQQARIIFNQMSDVYFRAFADNNLGGIALNQGRLAEALDFYNSALDTLKKIEASDYVIGALHMNIGATYIRRHEINQAFEFLQSSILYFEKAQTKDFLPEVTRHIARAHLYDHQIAEAEVQALKALKLAKDLSMRNEEGYCLRALGEIYRQQGKLTQAKAVLLQSIKVLEDVGEEYELGRSHLILAHTYLDERDYNSAQAEFNQCIPVFERLEAQLDLATAQELRRQIQ